MVNDMEYIVGAILLSGCSIGGSLLFIGALNDSRKRRQMEAYRAVMRDKQRLKEEKAAWRGIDLDIIKENAELRLENESLKRKITSMEALMAKIKVKDA